MTASDRVAVLDGELREGYEDFDGFILDERSRAQREANEAGSGPGGLYDEGGSGNGNGELPGGAGELPGVRGAGDGSLPGVVASSGAGDGEGPQAGGSGGSVGGLQGGPAGEEGQYPVPDDIPSGRDDDVVARQIREAAMSEPDPELRERLWDEYRRYTGLSD